MRTRYGRDAESLLRRLAPDEEPIVRAAAVKRPTVAAYRRTLRMTPEERIDRAFALLAFARSLRRDLGFAD